MASLWRPGKGVIIKEVSDKRYLFTFYDPVDMKRGLDGGPWQFERNLLILKEIKPNDIPHKICLNEAEYWVQVHNVPYSLMNLGTTRWVGNFIGKFINYDDKQFGEKWESYMHIRVCMNVKPLKRGTTLKKEGIGYWVDFKYERLQNFCFVCGIIGHSENFCLLAYEEDLVLDKRFGVQLRAGSRVKTSPTCGSKWLVDGSSSSSRGPHIKEDNKSDGRREGINGGFNQKLNQRCVCGS
ncbi:unnamed protein product [Cuscuta epithymum]|uniref:DUF4283 domain-containing protein n=1 Tax=Cuscuta epithymum TaxID=186058 RepID=A0AAV0G5W5_9ASTE|nr:unnamed protein product [Cuscuta epithymum]